MGCDIEGRAQKIQFLEVVVKFRGCGLPGLLGKGFGKGEAQGKNTDPKISHVRFFKRSDQI
jgi:hypothetical protein